MTNNQSGFQLMVLLMSMSIALAGCGSGDGNGSSTPQPTPPTTQTCAGQTLSDGAECMRHNGRDVIIFSPDNQAAGIALFLHGAPGHPQKVMNIFDAQSISSDLDLLAAAPQGSDSFWGWSSINNGTSVTDTAYLSGLVDTLRAENNITADQVYVFGYSAGGFMAYKLACTMPEQLTGIISLAGQFRGEFEHCSTSTSLKVHHFHSPSDSDVPMAGRSTGQVRSVSETLAHWQQINGCSDTSSHINHPGVTSSSAGTRTQSWDNCSSQLLFSQMDGVPHEAAYKSDILRQIYSPIFE